MQNRWQNRVKDVVQNKLDANVLAAFNTNVDVVVHLNNEFLKGLQADSRIDLDEVKRVANTDIGEINNENEFLAVLLEALGEGKSHYVVLRNLDLLEWLEEKFSVRQESMGGQAGIIANQMAALGANSIVYTSLLSPKQGSMFFPEVKVPVVDGQLKTIDVMDAVRPADHTKENWIFEYAKGEKFEIAGQVIETPRANRVILATRPEGVVMNFSPELQPVLPQLGQEVDVAFLAGFHYAPTEKEALHAFLEDGMASVAKLKEANADLRLHFEYVPMNEDYAEKTMLQAVASQIQSFGINENEIKRVLDIFGHVEESSAIDENERAYSLYKGVLRVFEDLQFDRIQLHNLGYYVVILKKDYEIDPSHVRDACLYASAVNALKAKYGGYVPYDKLPEAGDIGLSEIGLKQVRAFAEEMRGEGLEIPANFEEDGIAEFDDHIVLVVPAHVVPNPVSTVGMGDTISSSSYAYEWSFRSS